MHGAIKKVLNEINNDKLRHLVERVIDVNYDAFVTQPAACGNHHAYTGGLLTHSVRTAMVGAQLCDYYEGIYHPNRDVVIAGGFLHDIGKVHCYKVKQTSDGEEIESTQMSKYHHHIPIGYHIVMREAEWIEKNNPDMAMDSDPLNRLLHIIISHHGRLEYRSNRRPKTEEAFLVHIADTVDAYMDADKMARKTFNR